MPERENGVTDEVFRKEKDVDQRLLMLWNRLGMLVKIVAEVEKRIEEIKKGCALQFKTCQTARDEITRKAELFEVWKDRIVTAGTTIFVLAFLGKVIHFPAIQEWMGF